MGGAAPAKKSANAKRPLRQICPGLDQCDPRTIAHDGKPNRGVSAASRNTSSAIAWFYPIDFVAFRRLPRDQRLCLMPACWVEARVFASCAEHAPLHRPFATGCKASPFWIHVSSPDEPLPSNNTMAPIEPVAHFRRASRRADKHVAKLERKIARFRAAGDHHRANQLERLLMRSHDLRLLSANRAAAKLTKKLRKHRGDRGSVTGPTKADVLRMARDLSLWRSSNEVVRLTTIPKAEGWRRIHSFGFEHRTRQEMLRRVIKAKGQTLPEQREATAAGVPALIENIARRSVADTSTP